MEHLTTAELEAGLGRIRNSPSDAGVVRLIVNVPAGTRLALGSTVIEVTDVPHTGCRKFVSRFGLDAMTFVSSATGRSLNLRGINARVVQPGSVRVGDAVREVSGKD